MRIQVELFMLNCLSSFAWQPVSHHPHLHLHYLHQNLRFLHQNQSLLPPCSHHFHLQSSCQLNLHYLLSRPPRLHHLSLHNHLRFFLVSSIPMLFISLCAPILLLKCQQRLFHVFRKIQFH